MQFEKATYKNFIPKSDRFVPCWVPDEKFKS